MAAMALMIVVLLLGAGMAPAQQEEGPILRPKKPIAKPASPSLLVICDLACNWMLDEVAKGRIDAGGSVKVKVELGHHVVAAATEDGLDKDEKELDIKAGGQTIVHIALQPFRDARLKAEQEARDKAAHQQQERERVAREETGVLTWTDPATRLMWTKKDNGSEVSWGQAVDYCRNLRLAGHSDWRAPTLDELNGIADSGASVSCYSDKWKCHVKGNLRLSTGWVWGRKIADVSGQIHVFAYDQGIWSSEVKKYEKKFDRALCVRRSGE
jgi:hypothetical protein